MADPMAGGPPQQGSPMQGAPATGPQVGGGQPMQNAPQAQPGMPPQGGPAAAQAQLNPAQGTFGADQQTDPQEQQQNFIDFALSQANLAKKMSKSKKKEEILEQMGREIVEGYEEDVKSRQTWMDHLDEWTRMATLIRDVRVYPWPKASNIKYPLLATAAMQFTARAYPALVPADGHLVKTKIVQKDPSDQIYLAAERVSQHMSFQIMHRMPNWEEDMDKLLAAMAIAGIAFKKTYFDNNAGCVHSHFIPPERLVINYHARSIEKAYRKTEILHYTDNEVQSKVRNNEEFLDLDFPEPSNEEQEQKRPVVSEGAVPPPGKSTPHVFLACHTFWDLDDDGYEEPYIITVHKATKQVVRIIARWKVEDVKRNDDGEIQSIKPVEYFTAFPFIPNPDGSIYGLGFGLLLGPLNESSNTLINQLVDAGTINNLQSGFIGKGLRLKMGQTTLQPGEFKVVNATGMDLKDSIFMLPTKEPSNVLMSLLQMLVQAGNQLASIAEIFVGKMPGQNTPATTTQETVQQGMAVFTAIYKRVYRSLAQEFQKIYWLNKINPETVDEESKVSGIQLQASDYDLPEWVIIPGADPTGDSSTTRMAKLQQVGQLLQMGTIDPMQYTRMVLDANEIPNAQQLMRQPQPQGPDPKVQQAQMEMQQGQQEHQAKMAEMAQKTQQAERMAQIKQAELEMKSRHEEQMMAIKLQTMGMETRHKEMSARMDRQHQAMEAILNLHTQRAQSQQDLQANLASHDQQQAHAKAQSKQTLTLKDQAARQQLKQKQAAADQQQAQAQAAGSEPTTQ